MGYKGWKRRWCVVEDGLFQYFESFDSARDQPLGLVPLQGASIRQPKTARANRPSIVGPTVGPAWRLDTAATGNDKFHQKCAAPPLSLSSRCCCFATRIILTRPRIVCVRRYILAGDDAETSDEWKAAMQAHIDYAGVTQGDDRVSVL